MMGKRFCPICGEVVEVKVLMTGYRQEMRDGIPVKVRRVKHKAKDGGCDQVFETYEAFLRVMKPRGIKKHRIENENGNEHPTTVNNEQTDYSVSKRLLRKRCVAAPL